MQALRATGDANWAAFVHPDVQPLPQGHLLNYPNNVGYDGSVGPLPDCEEFPDLVRLLLLTMMMIMDASPPQQHLHGYECCMPCCTCS